MISFAPENERDAHKRHLYSYIGLLFFLYLFFTFDTSGQSNVWFKKLSIEDGLSHNTVYSILQDTEGFIWIGTKNGLNCYDGYTFRIYDTNLNDSTSLSNSWVNTLFQDSKGFIWIGTEGGGLNRLNKKTGIIERFINKPDNKNSLLSNYVYAITEDSNSNLWIGTEIGISVLDASRESFKNYVNKSADPNSLSTAAVYDILVDSRQRIWIATYGGGLNLFDKSTDGFKHFVTRPKDKSSVSSDTIWQIKQDRNNPDVLWVTTFSGLNRLDYSTGSFSSFIVNEGKENVKQMNRLQPLLIDNKNRIWTGSDMSGLNYMDPVTSEIHHFEYDPYKKNGLSGNSILFLFQDRTGLIWVATRYYGINLIYENNFNCLPGENISSNGLPEGNVFSIYEKGEAVWIGMDKGLFKYNRLKGNVVQYDFDKGVYPVNQKHVYSVFLDRDDDLWVGTNNAGLYLLSKNSTVFRKYINEPGNNSSICSNGINSITQDKNGTIWIGTRRGGLSRFDKPTGIFINYKSDPGNGNSLSGNFINDLLVDSRNNLWIALSGGGLNKFDIDKNQFTRFQSNPKDTTTINDDYIKCLAQIDESTICAGSYSGGLNLLDINTGRFTHVMRRNGLSSNMIASITQDSLHNLWFGTNNGLSKFNPASGRIWNYGTKNGLSNLEFNTGAVFNGASGFIYFGGVSGLTYFNPKKIDEDNYIPVVTIIELKISDRSGAQSKKSVNKLTSFDKDTISLRYNQSSFTIRFSSMLYSNTGTNEYKYILEEYEKSWSIPSVENVARYSNIPPGKYIFKVKGSNSEGVWNDNYSQRIIIITRPFWKTLWFRIVLIGIAIYLLYLIFLIRERALRINQEMLARKIEDNTIEIRQQNIEILSQRDHALKQKMTIEAQNAELEKHRFGLEQLVRERTLELEFAREKAEESERLKSGFLANMSHEIRTPMNAIIGFSSLLTEEEISKKEKEEYLNIINRSGLSLMQLIDDILDLSTMEAGKVELSLKSCNVNEILSQLYDIFSKRNINSTKKNVTFTKKPLQGDELIIYSDPIRLSQILSNLLDNAFKFTEAGSIEYGCELFGMDRDKQIRFYVKDTGIGLTSEQAEKLFVRFSRITGSDKKLYRGTGLGLSICKNLVELLGGKIWVESEYNVGSVFYISIPFSPVKGPDEISESDLLVKNSDSINSKVIMIVEDDYYSLVLLKTILSRSNYRIIEANDGLEAIENVKNNQIDLILMDINLPNMNGYQATEIIKKINKDIIVIAQTANAFETDRAKCLKSGCDDMITKPVTASSLNDVVKKFLN